MSDKEISELNMKNAEHYGLQLQMNHFAEDAEFIQQTAYFRCICRGEKYGK